MKGERSWPWKVMMCFSDFFSLWTGLSNMKSSPLSQSILAVKTPWLWYTTSIWVSWYWAVTGAPSSSVSRAHWYSPVDVASKRSDEHLKRSSKPHCGYYLSWTMLLLRADTGRQGGRQREKRERERRNKTKEMNLMSIVLMTWKMKSVLVIYFCFHRKIAWCINRKLWGYLKGFIALLVIWSCCRK